MEKITQGGDLQVVMKAKSRASHVGLMQGDPNFDSDSKINIGIPVVCTMYHKLSRAQGHCNFVFYFHVILATNMKY
jgi:hypothetical protein